MSDNMEGKQPFDQASACAGDNGQRLRILLVEDDVQAARNLCHLLMVDGFAVDVAANGPSALQLAGVNAPDVVLLDLGLPGMDGYEVAKQLLEQKARKRPLLIAVTGYAEEAERLRSYEVGIDLHLTKPVSIGELRQFLDRYETLRRPSTAN